tara:strand:- start:8905 stop:10596 length:1692 start_codon:yes stop_codon:yes gene_type:complete
MFAPLSFSLILIGAIFSGLLQSASVLTIMPLVKYLNVIEIGSSNLFFIRYFEAMISWLGFDKSIFTVLWFMVLLTWSILAVGYIINSYGVKVKAKITRKLRERVINVITKAQWIYFVEKRTGSVAYSVLTETSKSVAGFEHTTYYFCAILEGVVLLITTFLVSPLVSLIVLLTSAVLFIVLSPWFSYAKQVGTKERALSESITVRITDGLLGIKPLKAMNNDRFLIPIINNETAELEKQQVKSFMVYKFPEIIRDSSIILILALGAYYIIEYSIVPLISLFPMIALYRVAMSKLGTVHTQIQKLKGIEPYYISLKKGIAEANRLEEKNEGTLEPIFNDRITVNNVDFSYPTKNVLSNVSMVVPKNSFIVLMGESGGGKTTFSDILCALFVPDSGEVLVDGRSLHELDIKKWRRMIGYVPQDLFLFHDTIMHNVTLGNLKIKKEDVVIALKDSGAWGFVSELPEGMNTIIGERGIRLSGGQRQRISIARAIVREPQLLILDEATTALDPATEEKILLTLRKLTDKGITIIAVSHQTSVLDIADDVYRLEAGRFEKVEIKEKVGT